MLEPVKSCISSGPGTFQQDLLLFSLFVTSASGIYVVVRVAAESCNAATAAMHGQGLS